MELRRVDFAANGSRQFHVPVHGVDFRVLDGYAVCVEGPCKLARVGKPDANRGTGLPGEPAAAKETLNVNNEVKSMGVKIAMEVNEGSKGFGVVPGGPKATAIEQDHFVQIGVVLQEPGAVRRDQPGDVGVGVLSPEQMKDGQGMDDVAK